MHLARIMLPLGTIKMEIRNQLCSATGKKKNTVKKDKYLSPGPVLASALDLFLNKAGLIKVVSLAVRVLPLILEFPRKQNTC